MGKSQKKLKSKLKLEEIKSKLTKEELKILNKLSTPIKVQDFLDTLPFNLEKKIETDYSPRLVIKNMTAHCLEGALFAALAIWLHGGKPLLLDLKAPDEVDHVVTLYSKNGYWGAISKTNHGVLRFRDPIYKTCRELALSYFHEYTDNRNGRRAGQKLLKSFAGPIDLREFNKLDKNGDSWVTSEKSLLWISDWLEKVKHIDLVPKENMKFLRRADKIEMKTGEIVEWQ